MTVSNSTLSRPSISSGERATVFALVGSGHTVSHIYILTLPPLFPLIKAEFDFSYAALGLLVTAFHVTTGALQVPAGFLVDRIGARATLIGGLMLAAICIGAIGLVDDYAVMFALALLAGAGNSVFHPADYAVMAAAVEEQHLGKAFGFHLMTGNLGFMVTPALMVALASLWDWRVALVAVGGLGVAVAVAMLLFGHVLRADRAVPGKKKASGAATGARVLTSGPVLTMLLFFVLVALVTAGMQTFAVTALVDMHGISLTAANAGLTAFLVGGFLGVILGGFVADGLQRPAITVTGTMVAAAVCLALVGMINLPTAALIAVLGLAGTLIGIMRPARDMMVNSITPPGTTRKVFGFVSTGLSAGSAIAPVALGWIVDLGAPGWVFALIVGFILTSIVIATVADRMAGGAREANLRAAGTPAE